MLFSLAFYKAFRIEVMQKKHTSYTKLIIVNILKKVDKERGSLILYVFLT